MDEEPTGQEPPAAEPNVEPQVEPEEIDPQSVVAERDKWKALSRKHEADLKAIKKQLADANSKNMTQEQAAIAQAVNEAVSNNTSKFVAALASAELKAALTGVVADPAAIIETLDLRKFVSDDATIDQDAIQSLRKVYAGLKPASNVDLHQGSRGKPSSPSIQEQIAAAEAAGDYAKSISLKTNSLMGMMGH